MSIALVFHLGSRLLPYLPPALGYRLCDYLSFLAPLSPAWPQILANLERVVPHEPAATRRRYAREIVDGLLKNYYDLLRAHALSPSELARTCDIRGLPNLLGALARGKGVLVAMPHIGNLSLVAEPVATLAQSQIVVIVEQMQDPAVHRLLNTLRRRSNTTPVEIGPHSARAIIQALRAGQIVVLPCDRTVAGATVEVTFFGAPAVVPAGPATLALRTGAPLLTAYTYRQPDNRSTVVIDPPLALDRGADLTADIQRTMQAILRIFEAYIRRHPAQWLLTEPLWATT